MLVNNGLVYLIALPLFGAALLLLAGRRADRWGHLLATALSGMSFILGAVQFYEMLGRSLRIARFRKNYLVGFQLALLISMRDYL